MAKVNSMLIKKGKRIPSVDHRLGEQLLTFIGLMRVRIREMVTRSRSLWWLIYVAATLLDIAGSKFLASKLFATGQRSAADPKLRAVFGHSAERHLKAIINTSSVNSGETGVDLSRLRVLKPYFGPDEKGVIHVMFSDVISALPRRVNLATLNSYFRLVLEPSWAGICDPGILQYACTQYANIVMAPDTADYEFIKRISSRLVPVALGSCDWVNPEIASPYLGADKKFDIVMNAIWAPWKRHHVLFSAMRRMRHRPRVALIGVGWGGGNIDRIARLARYYGVEKSITIFERIPYSMVMEVVCSSKCSVLLSLKEGANRALAESMFCDVPVLLLSEYVGGGEKNVVRETGVISPERDLTQWLDQFIAGNLAFSPREWALRNISCFVSTSTLNQKLCEVAVQDGEGWTRDIAVRANSPESRYVYDSDEVALSASNAAVAAFISGDRNIPIP